MKKTALDDDALIYQKRTEEKGLQRWKKLDKGQRKQYFLDYYLFPSAVGFALVFVALFLVWHFVKPKQVNVLYVAVIDDSLDAEKKERMIQELETMYGADGKYETVMIDDSFYSKDGALSKLEVYLYSSQVDAVIADEEMFRELAGYGFFRPADTLFGAEGSAGYAGRYLYAAGYGESGDAASEDPGTGRGETLPYGVDISESPRLTGMLSYMERPVFAVAVDAPNEGNAVLYLEYLMEGKGKESWQ